MAALAPTFEALAEFAFTDRHFSLLRGLVTRHAGIHLSDAKRQLIYGRLTRRIRALELSGFDAYCDLLHDPCGQEIENFVNAVTTNLTSFFRENHHFEYLAQTVVPDLQRRHAGTRRIRIWSAGCSTGEEPYSIAMTVLEALGERSDWDVQILATDIDSNVVATASAGVYPEDRQQGLNEARRKRWFTADRGGPVQAKSAVREILRFAQLNLMGDWPFNGPFDAIFCRNVAIYFDEATQGRLFHRYADVLANHGRLFIGHSETMFRTCDRFDLIGHTTYRLLRAK